MRTCEQALEAVAERPAAAADRGPAYVGLAEAAYQRNELGRALEYVTEGIALCRSFVYTMPLAAGPATLAWIRQARASPCPGAMDEAVQATPGPPPACSTPSRRGGRGLLLAQGDLGGAARWTQQAGLWPGRPP